MSRIPCVGFGFDSHLFSESGTLVFGGKKFLGIPKLKGHSDGDALIHAVIDALLGATVMGDIGDLFPDTSSQYKGISSEKFLSSVMKKLSTKKWKVHHLDVTVVAERPKLSKTKQEIRKNLSKHLKVPMQNVSIKAKTPEGLNLFKKPGGIAVWAIATVIGK